MKKEPFLLKKIQKIAFVLGVDEAGRGAWAGPVVSASVAWRGKNPIKNILNDSKKMSSRNREKTYQEILQIAHAGKLFYGIGIIGHDMIDRVGIREANRQAMEIAINQIGEHGDILLIDGRDNYSFKSNLIPEYIICGDSKVKQIMAASVLAKVTRDKLMCDYEKSFPGYGFEKHKGYGTELHQKTLKKLGVCRIHRKSYAPIKLATSGKAL